MPISSWATTEPSGSVTVRCGVTPGTLVSATLAELVVTSCK